MATGALVIGWGPAVRGREQKALQVFNEAIQYYTRLQQQGTIESFEPVALEPHGGDLEGFLLIRGDRVDLDDLAVPDREIEHEEQPSTPRHDESHGSVHESRSRSPGTPRELPGHGQRTMDLP